MWTGKFEMKVKMRTFLMAGVPILVLLVVAVTLFANSWLRSFLRSGEFRALISEKTSSALQVQGEYLPLSWTGFSVYSPGFQANGIAGSPVALIQADQIRTTLLWREAFGGIWKLDGISIAQLRLILGEEAAARLSVQRGQPRQGSLQSELPAWLPQKFDLGEVVIDTAVVEFSEGSVRGMRATVKQQGAGWEIAGSSGRFVWPGIPENTLRQSRARITREGFFLTNAELLLRPGGQVNASGEISTSSGELSMQIRWSEVPAKEIIGPHDGFSLDGMCSGEAIVRVPKGARAEVSGRFLISEGSLRDVPILSVLGRFTGASRFDPLPLNQLSGKFENDDLGTRVTELVLESQGLLRVEGTLNLITDNTLEGNLLVVLTPSTLQWLPGSRERVFLDSRDGYLWTAVNVGGTLDYPTEDLSVRLARAMGEEVISSGPQIIEGAADTAVEGIRGILNLLNPPGN